MPRCISSGVDNDAVQRWPSSHCVEPSADDFVGVQDTINPTPPQKVAMTFAYKDMHADIEAMFAGNSGEQELPAAAAPGEAASNDAIEVNMHFTPQAIAFAGEKHICGSRFAECSTAHGATFVFVGAGSRGHHGGADAST